MFVGAGALFIAGLFFFIMAVEVASDAWLLIAVAMLGLSVWLFVQAIKTPGFPSRR